MDSLIPIHSPHPLPSNDVRRQPPCCRVDLSKRVYQKLSNHARNAAHPNVRCFSFAGEAFANPARKPFANLARKPFAAQRRRVPPSPRANCGRRPRQRAKENFKIGGQGGNPKGGAALFGQSLPTFCWSESGGPARPERVKGKIRNIRRRKKDKKRTPPRVKGKIRNIRRRKKDKKRTPPRVKGKS